MVNGYFNANKHNDIATFEIFFRKAPFGLNYAIFSGTPHICKYLEDFSKAFTGIDTSEMIYMRSLIERVGPANDLFITTLQNDKNFLKDITIRTLCEGCIVFPGEPMIQLTGPIWKLQLLETSILSLVNYSTLVATNAFRFRCAAGPDSVLMEFGSRRAHGTQAALLASYASYIGGFDKTSNILAGYEFDIPVGGTCAHSWIQSFGNRTDSNMSEHGRDIYSVAKNMRYMLSKSEEEMPHILKNAHMSHEGELQAFCELAASSPDNFLPLIDTYTIDSGLANFLMTAYAAYKVSGRVAKGVRIDSGNLIELSHYVRKIFTEASGYMNRFNTSIQSNFLIVVSNDITVDDLYRMKVNKCPIDGYGVGTWLVACKEEPALGGVYKLVEINSMGVKKNSATVEKSTKMYKKDFFRITDESNKGDYHRAGDIICKYGEIPNGYAYADSDGYNRLKDILKNQFSEDMVDKFERGNLHISQILLPILSNGQFLQRESIHLTHRRTKDLAKRYTENSDLFTMRMNSYPVRYTNTLFQD